VKDPRSIICSTRWRTTVLFGEQSRDSQRLDSSWYLRVVPPHGGGVGGVGGWEQSQLLAGEAFGTGTGTGTGLEIDLDYGSTVRVSCDNLAWLQ